MNILKKISDKVGQIALLIDPEKTNTSEQLEKLLAKANFAEIDYIFIGGSSVTSHEFNDTIAIVKQLTKIPIVIFPGSNNQISEKADAILFLNLISGRNPDYLIGHHVACAEELLGMDIEVIPTSYLLIDGGKMTSVAYVSQTTPIPRDNIGIALKTGIAGYLLGHKITFFDAGSGAYSAVPTEMINELKSKIDSPIIVGGGIKSIEEIEQYTKAKANVIVIGNKIETDLDFLLDIQNYLSERRF